MENLSDSLSVYFFSHQMTCKAGRYEGRNQLELEVSNKFRKRNGNFRYLHLLPLVLNVVLAAFTMVLAQF
jgi:hypothetical protein